MTKLITSLAEISERYDAVYCDLWGCLHNGQRPYAAAVAALRGFRAKGGKVLLLTNSPRPKPGVIRQLDLIGVPRDCWDEIVSSGDATQIGLATGIIGTKVHHIGAEKDLTFFTDIPADLPALADVTRVPMDQATGILCTGLADDLTETPDDYRAALLMGKTLGLTMLCANPDIVVDMGDTRVFCAGALAAEYEAMGGTAMYFGKPHPPIYDLARLKLAAMTGEEDHRILAIGDGIATDVQGALAEGIDALFVTGGIAAAEFGADPAHPDATLLAAWLDQKQMAPQWAIGHLR